MGAASSVYTDRDGNIWVLERCGQNSCVDRDDFSPIHVYDRNGRWIKSFGKGLLAWPHGIYVDDERQCLGHRCPRRWAAWPSGH